MNKKVLVFSHEFPPQQGGEGTYAYELASGLNKLNYNVYVLAGTTFSKNLNSVPIDSDLFKKNIKIERYDWVKKNRLWFISWRKIFTRYIKNEGPFDYIFFANFTSCVIGHRISNDILPPYSITIHGDDIDYYFTNKKFKSRILIKKAGIKTFFENANKIICVSKFAKKNLIDVIPFSIDSEVIHHGIESRDITLIQHSASEMIKLIRRDKKISKDKTILIYVSRLESMKGQDKLIDILCKKGELVKKTHTFFVGGGSQYQSLKKLVDENNISHQVTFTGEIPREEVMKYMSFADIVIFLSDHPKETFGLVILEGMLMKKPVVVLNHGGMVEVVQHSKNGFIVNTDEIESTLSLLVNDKNLRERMGEEGRKLIDTKFNNENMVLETISGQSELCVE